MCDITGSGSMLPLARRLCKCNLSRLTYISIDLNWTRTERRGRAARPWPRPLAPETSSMSNTVGIVGPGERPGRVVHPGEQPDSIARPGEQAGVSARPGEE